MSSRWHAGRGRDWFRAFFWALALVWASSPAWAHAPAQATGVLPVATPAGPGRWVRTNRGIIFQGAAAEPPRFLCNEAYSASLSEAVPTLASPEGLMVATYAGGILQVDAASCGVHPAEAPLRGRSVVDLAVSGDGHAYFALLAPSAERLGAILSSTDGGHTWQEQGALQGFGSSLGVTASNPQRVYVTAQLEGDDEASWTGHSLLVSADAGTTFSGYPLSLLDAEVRAYLLALDPQDEERVLLRVLPGNPETPERVLLSEDGGQNFDEVFSAVGPLVAAFDGEQLWLGGHDGLFQSNDRGRTFRAVASSLSRVGCLSPSPDGLTACGYQDLAFGVFAAPTNSAEFRPTLRFADVTQLACGDDAELASQCEANLLDWIEENSSSHEPELDEAVGGSPSLALAASDAEPRDDPGCALGVGGRRPSFLALALLLTVALHRSSRGRELHALLRTSGSAAFAAARLGGGGRLVEVVKKQR